MTTTAGWRRRTPRTSRTDPHEGAYNGFSGLDRTRATEVGDAHPNLRPRWVPRGWECAACGLDGDVLYWHNEDYRAPLDSLVVCPWCHWAIHRRYESQEFFLRWRNALQEGFRPQRTWRGVRWHHWRREYLLKDPDDWAGEWTGKPLMDGLLDLLPLTYSPEVPPALAIADGAPHHRCQWVTDPPLRFQP